MHGALRKILIVLTVAIAAVLAGGCGDDPGTEVSFEVLTVVDRGGPPTGHPDYDGNSPQRADVLVTGELAQVWENWTSDGPDVAIPEVPVGSTTILVWSPGTDLVVDSVSVRDDGLSLTARVEAPGEGCGEPAAPTGTTAVLSSVDPLVDGTTPVRRVDVTVTRGPACD